MEKVSRMNEQITIIPDGKYLIDLISEVDVLRKTIIISGDNNGCICWQENGLLAYFDYEDGLPGFYWAEHHKGDSRESFISLSNLIQYMMRFNTFRDGKPRNEGYDFLLTQPVWKVMEDKNEANREAFNNLLGDIEIDL